MSDPLTFAALVSVTFIAAGFVKGVVGMGLPTVAMALLGLAMSPAAAAALLIVPSLLTNVWQFLAGVPVMPIVRRLATMMLALLIGTSLTIGVLTGESSSLASGALGAILALYALVGLAAPRFSVPAHAERWLSPLIGLSTGLISGATGLFAIPAVPYLAALGLSKDELIQALGLSFTVATLALAAALAVAGKLHWMNAGNSLLAIIPALFGMFIGQRVRDKLQPEVFRRCFFSGMAMLGVFMLGRAVLRG